MQLWKLASSKSSGWVSRLEIQGRTDAAAQVQRPSAEFLPALGVWSFVLFESLTDWERLTHIMEGNLLYSKATDLGFSMRLD